MIGVIHQVASFPGAGSLPVAGSLLVALQLEWLRACGCERIAVEVGTDAASGAIAAWLAENGAALGAEPVLTRRPLGPVEVARRAGFPRDQAFLALPGDVLGDGDLGQLFRYLGAGPVVAQMRPPPGLTGAHSGTVRLIDGVGPPERPVLGPGWAARLPSAAAALALGSLILEEKLPAGGDHLWPPQVRGGRVSPGVWLGRGAEVDPEATLVPPVWVGPSAWVCRGATIGPNAVIGARAVIDRGSVVVGSAIGEGAIVGQGLELRGCVVGSGTITRLSAGSASDVDDPLLLGQRARALGFRLWPRLAALVLAALLAPLALPIITWRIAAGRLPWRTRRVRVAGERVVLHEGSAGIALADALPRLFDVLLGRRALLGVAGVPEAPDVAQGLRGAAEAAPRGAFDITPGLLAGETDPAQQLRAMAWYAHAKSPRVDAALLRRSLRA